MKKLLSFVLVAAVAVSFTACFNVNIDTPDIFSSVSPIDAEPSGAAEPTAYYSAEPTDFSEPAVSEEPASVTEAVRQTEATEFHDDYDLPEYSTAGIIVTDNAEESSAEESSAAAEKSPVEMSDEELLRYFNKTLNAVKTDKTGFKKSKLTSVLDLQLSNSAANSIVSIVKSALLSDTAEETTVNRGESSDDVMSPSGRSFVSDLTGEDISYIKIGKSGEDYVITVGVKDLVNPDMSSAYGKIFDFVTVDDVINIYAPKVGATVAREDIEVVFSDCYAEATVSPDGRVTGYKTYVKGIMNLNNATVKKVITINTDVAVTLGSTTEYTNFVY